MKKTYINPAMEIVKIQTMQMLAASENVEFSSDPIGGGDAVGRNDEFDW